MWTPFGLQWLRTVAETACKCLKNMVGSRRLELPTSSVSREKYQSLTDAFLVFSATYVRRVWTPFGRQWEIFRKGTPKDSGGWHEIGLRLRDAKSQPKRANPWNTADHLPSLVGTGHYPELKSPVGRHPY